jgi:hypothetical protein
MNAAGCCPACATSLRAIADGLNERGIPAARGGQWSSPQVMRVLERMDESRPFVVAAAWTIEDHNNACFIVKDANGPNRRNGDRVHRAVRPARAHRQAAGIVNAASSAQGTRHYAI